MMIHSQTVVCEFIALCVLVLLPIVRADLPSLCRVVRIHEESVLELYFLLLLYMLHSQYCVHVVYMLCTCCVHKFYYGMHSSMCRRLQVWRKSLALSTFL